MAKNEMSSSTPSTNPENTELAKKARTAMSDVSEKAESKLSKVKERVSNLDMSELRGRAKHHLKNAQSSTSNLIRNRPLASLGVAMAAGFIFASAFRRRS